MFLTLAGVIAGAIAKAIGGAITKAIGGAITLAKSRWNNTLVDKSWSNT